MIIKCETIRKELKRMSDPAKAKVLAGFFKTGEGEYGEGDVFLGVTVPKIRTLTKKFRTLELDEVVKLLKSPVHEERLTALLLMVSKFQRTDESERGKICETYLEHTKWINNWDLVDLSAEKIVGPWYEGRDRTVLIRLARSPSIWERRIAILSTFHYIKRGYPAETLRIAKILLKDRHDLIHKAVGWMLREVGKRCARAVEERFLKEHAAIMPRTMLRYAVERFPEPLKRHYMEIAIQPQPQA